MRLSDIQPHYFPRLHYFARMLDSDVFVIRDDVQFVRNHRFPGGDRRVSHQAHAPIRGGDEIVLLGVPARRGSRAAIAETEVSYDHDWRRKHLNLIRHHYRGTPGFDGLVPEIAALLERRFASLGELDVATIAWGLDHLLEINSGDPTRLELAAINEWLVRERPPCRLRHIELGSETAASSTASDASRRIVELCERFGATEYIAGGTAVDAYLDPHPFEQAGIAVSVQRWTCPRYPQRGDGFFGDLSILDLLFNGARPQRASLLQVGPDIGELRSAKVRGA